MAATAADLNLLFGLLALQIGLIDQGQLVAAFQAWSLDKSRSLADYLTARGDLDADQLAALKGLAALHLKKHGGSTESSLAALPAGRSTREQLEALADPALTASVATAGTRPPAGVVGPGEAEDVDRTASYAVGAATSEGQRFRILRPHARGGLGAVFVAVDAELPREVALKQILDQHADDPTSRQRFLVEAEITGGLEHPGIVPVYGLGTYADGRPFYAMRFIRGESLKEAIEAFHADDSLRHDPGARSLALRRLLRRFLDICNAIDYAHGRGVLHRDIKPGNIIVGRHGETLVIDWGLAKAQGRSDAAEPSVERPLTPSSASGSAETLPGSALGTPAYMSPEQARGELERLGPRSDVYSLGATLYCLLVGVPPHQGELFDVMRAAQRGEFRRPRQRDPEIDRALEAICLKAMAPEPEDRYASARALADDVERWIADEPVGAWREPFLRRARRWARRNRTLVTGAAVALVAGVVGLSAVLVVQTRAKADLAGSLRRETHARTALAAANDELTRSKADVQARYELAVKAIKTFHTGVSEDFLLTEDRFRALRDRLLKSAGDFYGQLGALIGNRSDLASRTALWRANFELAELTGKVGTPEAALAAHRKVLAARQELAKDPGASGPEAVDVARSLLAIGRLLEATGKTGEARDAYERARSAASAADRTAPDGTVALAAAEDRIGHLLTSIGKDREGLATLSRARELRTALAAAHPEDAKARLDLGDSHVGLGGLLMQTGKHREAEAEFREALALYRRVSHEDPSAIAPRASLADCHNNLALVLMATGRFPAAEAESRESLALRQKIADENLAVTQFRNRLAGSHNALGLMLAQTGRPAMAEAEYRAALVIQQRLVDENPTVTDFRGHLAQTQNNLGSLLVESGEPMRAVAEFRKALAVQRRLADENPAVTDFRGKLAGYHTNLGRTFRKIGRLADARAEMLAAQGLLRKLADDNPAVTEFRRNLGNCHTNLGALLVQAGDPAGAEAEFRKSLAIFQRLVDDHPTVTDFGISLANSLANIGFVLETSGSPAESETAHRQAIAILQELLDANPTVTELSMAIGASHNSLGILLYRRGKPDEAEAEFREFLRVSRQLVRDDPGSLAFRNRLMMANENLAEVALNRGRPAEARAAYDEVIAIREALVREQPQVKDYRTTLAATLRQRGLACRRLGDLATAVDDASRALALWDGLSSRTGAECFETACCHAILAGLVGRAGSGIAASAAADHAERAMLWLETALDRGFRDRSQFAQDAGLDPIRSRPDFQLLMQDVAFPADPFAPRMDDDSGPTATPR